ncbi:MAG TPA: putative Na+/H+ antiporter [Vicinamibacterales bacterium]|jgi:hypothetical protein|nr:putative Na+/H+ antiporter [Vicinamibacterales bacterium]
MIEAIGTQFPPPLSSYPQAATLGATLAGRIHAEPFNAVATALFVLAVVHTFLAPRITEAAHRMQRRRDEKARSAGHPHAPSVTAEVLHLLGEVEVVFGAWAVVLLIAMATYLGRDAAAVYFSDTVDYSEAIFVVVVMAMASTRPIVGFAEGALRRVAGLGRGTPAAWWVSILVIGPLLGSLITEPAAMTISALLLARQFFDLRPSTALRYATLGLLFVNVSIGGTLTHFAAPPVLMVARPWGWTTWFMLTHFGWRATVAVVVSTAVYYVWFRREFAALALRPAQADVDQPDEEAGALALLPVPPWIVAVHIAFIAWTVLTSHYRALFVGAFLFFLGFLRATARYQSKLELRMPLLVGFFLAGLIIHGGLQGWWIAPVLASLSPSTVFAGSAALTAFNDNALITYLTTLVPNLGTALRQAVVEGAVVGGGLTVIANAPNPAGQALLGRFFDDAVSPIGLLAGAALPTVIAALAFRL